MGLPVIRRVSREATRQAVKGKAEGFTQAIDDLLCEGPLLPVMAVLAIAAGIIVALMVVTFLVGAAAVGALGAVKRL